MCEKYKNDVTQFQNIYASNNPLVNTLHSGIFKTLDQFDKTDWNLSQIFNNFKTILNEIIFFCPSEYFNKNFEQLCYEIALDVYCNTQTVDNSKPIIKEKIAHYITTCDTTCASEKLASRFSQNKKQLLGTQDPLTPAVYRLNKNLSNFYLYIYLPLKNGTTSLLNDSDFIFYMLHYSDTIFSNKKINTGVDIFNFYNFIHEYLSYHKTSSNSLFENEYSAYLFEQIFSPLQFEEGFYNILSEKSFFSEIPSSYWSLYLYTRIYDSPYLSLSDFIQEKYPNLINSVYNPNENLFHKNLYYEVYSLSSFWIPLCNLAIKAFLFYLTDGNFKEINQKCKTYIDTNLHQDTNYSYYKRITKSHNKIDVLKYPGNKKNVLSKAPKTGTPEQRFNYSFSQCLYNKHQFPYILHPNQNIYSIDNFIRHITQNYKFAKEYYPILSINTCPETMFATTPKADA